MIKKSSPAKFSSFLMVSLTMSCVSWRTRALSSSVQLSSRTLSIASSWSPGWIEPVLKYSYRVIINPLDSKGNYSATSYNTKLIHCPLMGLRWWAVTFGTVRRSLGGLRPRPVPSSLYQM